MKKLLLLPLLAAGCLSDPETSTAEQDVTPPPPTAFANDHAAFDFFVGKGLTNFQAAGIVGNLDQESGVDPNSVQYGGGPGRGIAQWSVGGRWDTSSPNVVHYASTQGEGVHTLNLQLEFIWLELTTVGYGYQQLLATTNVTDATLVFMDRYEICGTCASSQRISYAESVLNAYGQIEWGAHYVSQTWPLATTAMTIHCGESIPATLVMKNTGTHTWDGSTRLGTTQPRDRDSIFAGDDWVAPNRPAAIAGTVAPGANGEFHFTFNGPTGAACVPGTYKEYFGIVQDGVHWFSDNGEGGPADDQLEALIDLVAGDDAGSGSDGSGDGSGDTGSGSDGSDRDGSDGGPGNASAGCAAGGSGGFGLAFAALGALVVRRRVRRP